MSISKLYKGELVMFNRCFHSNSFSLLSHILLADVVTSENDIEKHTNAILEYVLLFVRYAKKL